MNFDNHGDRVTGALMQPVDILRHHGAQLAAAFELDKCAVTSIWLRPPCRMLETSAPCLAAYLWIGHIVVDVRQSFSLRVACPNALRPAEVRDTGFR